jgi:hypothetical protein
VVVHGLEPRRHGGEPGPLHGALATGEVVGVDVDADDGQLALADQVGATDQRGARAHADVEQPGATRQSREHLAVPAAGHPGDEPVVEPAPMGGHLAQSAFSPS